MFNIHILECENDSYYYESKPYLIIRRYLVKVREDCTFEGNTSTDLKHKTFSEVQISSSS